MFAIAIMTQERIADFTFFKAAFTYKRTAFTAFNEFIQAISPFTGHALQTMPFNAIRAILLIAHGFLAFSEFIIIE